MRKLPAAAALVVALDQRVRARRPAVEPARLDTAHGRRRTSTTTRRRPPRPRRPPRHDRAGGTRHQCRRRRARHRAAATSPPTTTTAPRSRRTTHRRRAPSARRSRRCRPTRWRAATSRSTSTPTARLTSCAPTRSAPRRWPVTGTCAVELATGQGVDLALPDDPAPGAVVVLGGTYIGSDVDPGPGGMRPAIFVKTGSGASTSIISLFRLDECTLVAMGGGAPFPVGASVTDSESLGCEGVAGTHAADLPSGAAERRWRHVRGDRHRATRATATTSSCTAPVRRRPTRRRCRPPRP